VEYWLTGLCWVVGWLVVTGLTISPNGIIIVKDFQGRAAGDGFVQFTSPDLVDQALEKHKEKIGHRWEDCVQSISGSGNWLIIGTVVWYVCRLAVNCAGCVLNRTGSCDKSDCFVFWR